MNRDKPYVSSISLDKICTFSVNRSDKYTGTRLSCDIAHDSSADNSIRRSRVCFFVIVCFQRKSIIFNAFVNLSTFDISFLRVSG